MSRKETAMEKLSASHVLNHLKNNGELKKFYDGILMQLKNTPSYKRLKQVSSMHMKGVLPDPSKSLPFSEGRLEKKRQIAEIGLLALSIDSSMSTLLSENLHKKAGSIIHDALKEILGKELKHPPEALIQAPRRLLEARENVPPKASKLEKDEFNKNMNAFLEKNNDSGKLFGTERKLIQNGEATSEHKDSHKPVKQPVPKNKISPEVKVKQTQKPALDSSKHSKNQKPSASSESSGGLPKKRKRKPNSKYVSKDLLLSNGIKSRVQELLDVQRDLNIINGTKPKSENNSLPPKKKSKAE